MFCKEKVSFYKKAATLMAAGKVTSVMIYNTDLFQHIACEFAPCL